jgi:hypothetical protein
MLIFLFVEVILGNALTEITILVSARCQEIRVVARIWGYPTLCAIICCSNKVFLNLWCYIDIVGSPLQIVARLDRQSLLVPFPPAAS